MITHLIGREGRTRRGMSAGFTVIELLVAVAVMGILVALLMPAVQQSREAARRTQCQSRLRQLALALHNYEEQHGAYPIGSMTVGSSFPTHSGWGWGAMLLPHLEQGALHAVLDFSVGTAVGTNRDALATPVPLWVCPSESAPPAMDLLLADGSLLSVATGNYCGVESVFQPMVSIRPRDIKDGLSQTLFIGERVFQPAIDNSLPYTSSWCGRLATQAQTLPNAIPHLPVIPGTSPNASLSDPNSFTSYHPGGVHFALGDGAVRFISESIDSVVYTALGTRNGGEVFNF